MKFISNILILFALSGCIETFQFDTENETPAVVVEGFISDISSKDYYEKYGELRKFYLRLKWASQVSNVRDENVEGAEIEIFSKTTNEYWDYTENEEGIYVLQHWNFRAVDGHEYQLQIKLSNGNLITSDFEVMPEQQVIGEIDFEETSKFQYKFEQQEQVIKEVDGVDVQVSLPQSPSVERQYYRWSYLTTWVLRAVLIPSGSPVGLCWVTEQYFLDEFQFAAYDGGVSKKELFFLPTNGNLPIEDGFVVRISQFSMDQNYFQFWEDLDKQKKQEDLFAPPPYNLNSNLSSETENLEVYGYFGVVKEHIYDWYFDLDKLSYRPTFIEPCYFEFANDRPAYCGNCMGYEGLKYGDEITNVKPDWWNY